MKLYLPKKEEVALFRSLHQKPKLEQYIFSHITRMMNDYLLLKEN